ncbi:hypothetical protein [Bisbaumannia pacifica]|uniref:SIR2-like domain-containing protein n=1 Tax=Bisbaumannia pacifica TaxID=77098 RepID=A0ABD4L5M7_9GAMM|nr:hypothetical protein [Halomonas pacifica]MBH8580938.1 hypothetical protein [Halomonas pacifica]
MNNRSTVLIVGAGASKEFGLPVGAELKEDISRLLDIRFGGFDQESGDYLIVQALKRHAKENEIRDINPHIHAGRMIRSAMPQAISIDNFIDAHRGNERIELMGKLAIVRAILTAEGRSKISNKGKDHEAFNFAHVQDAWLNPLFQLITENCVIDDLPNRLQNVTLIVFNYDRCIEHYLYWAFQTYYGVDNQSARDLTQSIEIFHPYGSVGPLPWAGSEQSIGFGADPNADQLLKGAKQIRTFTEGTDEDTSQIEEIRQRFSTAQILLFLGFAYHRLNLRLLSSNSLSQRVGECLQFGTALGISKSDCEIIRRQLSEINNANPDNINIRDDLTCSGLFQEYWRALSMSEIS